MSNRIALMLSICLLVCVLNGRVLACTGCAAPFSLGPCIKSANNIYVAKVLKKIAKNIVKVKVVRVIKGNLRVGEEFMFVEKDAVEDIPDMPEYIGEEFIFSDPKVKEGFMFEVLPLSYEEEVRLLIQENPQIKDVDTAIKFLRGVSVESQKIALKSVEERHAEAVDKIIEKMRELSKKVFDDRIMEEYRGSYYLNKYAEALLLKPSESGRNYVLGQIDEFVKVAEGKIVWDKERLAYAYSSRGYFLGALVWRTQKHPELHKEVKEKLLGLLPKLGEKQQAEVCFALTCCESASVEELQKILPGKNGNDIIALGLLWYNHCHFDKYPNQGRLITKDDLDWMRKVRDLASNEVLKEVCEENILRWKDVEKDEPPSKQAVPAEQNKIPVEEFAKPNKRKKTS